MSITLERATELTDRAAPSKAVSRLERALLAFGIAYGLAYIVANDVIAASMIDGYSRIDQAISELSSTASPARDFLGWTLPVSILLLGGFGIGVWKVAGRNRPLRVVGGILFAQAVSWPLWILAPMTSRDDLVAGAGGANDFFHIVLSAMAVLFIVTEMGFGAAAFGKRFRWFSIAMIGTTLVFGGLTGVLTADIAEGSQTSWMGFVERVSYGSWLLWMAVLSVILLRTQRKRGVESWQRRSNVSERMSQPKTDTSPLKETTRPKTLV